MDYPRHPNVKCQICGRAIYKRKSQIKKNKGHVFCSMSCYGKSLRREQHCIICGTMLLASLNKKTCSRACANKHRKGIKYKLNRPRDKVVDQRSIKLRLIAARGQACERCGYNKVGILHTHHKDRNRQNNVLSNLLLLCPNCHYEEHYLSKSWLKEKRSINYEKYLLLRRED
jgi:hypothetical protein